MATDKHNPPANTNQPFQYVGGLGFKAVDMDGPPASLQEWLGRARVEHEVYLIGRSIVECNDRALERPGAAAGWRTRPDHDTTSRQESRIMATRQRLEEW